MEFKIFAEPIKRQFDKLSKNSNLHRVDISRDEIWEAYLQAFPEGTNPIYKERTEHDCNCCKNFIRDVGSVVYLKDGKVETIWDVEIEGFYGEVAKAMAQLIRSKPISNVFTHFQETAGAQVSRQALEDGGVKSWNHFYARVPFNFVNRNSGELLGERKSAVGVFERGLTELTRQAFETVEELIEQNSLYRGEEHLQTIKEFKQLKLKYDKLKDSLEKNRFVWENVSQRCSRMKNSVIGTLIEDISTGVDLDKAVASFEAKVAPTNYKRPTALITKGMIDQAMKTVQELGIEPSLQRRFAKAEDLTINNVLFSDKKTSVLMKGGLRDVLLSDTKVSTNSFSKVEEISIDDFVKDIIPKITSMSVLFEGKFGKNLMSLIAPDNADAPNILKWNNNFSWTYNGDITDSIKEKVKKAGGNVEGFLRASLSWFNYDDLDIHLVEPKGYELFYGNRGSLSPSGARLDVDMNIGPESREAVENIFWKTKPTQKGWYSVYIHNYTKRETKDVGFVVQFEIDGGITNYSYSKAVGANQKVPVISFNWDGESIIEIKVATDIQEGGVSKEVWGIKTEQMQKVNILTISPNHWDDQAIGNKHYFFILEDCKNPDSARGLYNEFLRGDFDKHRKVFETIGSKLKCEASDNQLSGLGFSSTQPNTLLCEVKGTFNRMLKIKF